MRCSFWFVALAALVFGLHNAAAQTAPPPEAPTQPPSMNAQRIYEATKSRLVQVRTLLKDQDSQSTVGSGFVVDAQGLVITNYHVVSQFALKPERFRLSYSMPGGKSGTVQLLAIDVILDQALLRPGQLATDALDRIESKRRRRVLVRGMEVRSVVGRAQFRKHSNDDSKEARQLWHAIIVACRWRSSV